MLTQFKNPLITIGITLVSGLTSVAISAPAYSITLVDLSTFTSIGDVTSNKTVIQSGSPQTVHTAGGYGSVEEFLGLSSNAFDIPIYNHAYGSAIKKTQSFNAGDKFSFNWTFDTSEQDRAFVSINNEIAVLSGSNPYSYTFPTSGNYQVAMGVLDVSDATGVSTLTLSNAQIQPVPWETDTLPVLGSTVLFGIGVWAKRKYARNSQS
jgi:hypothetical protein